MTIILVLLIGSFALAAATALIRGLMAFLQDAEHLRQHGQLNEQARLEAFGVKQNRMMSQRVLFQGVAIALVALIGLLSSQS